VLASPTVITAGHALSYYHRDSGYYLDDSEIKPGKEMEWLGQQNDFREFSEADFNRIVHENELYQYIAVRYKLPDSLLDRNETEKGQILDLHREAIEKSLAYSSQYGLKFQKSEDHSNPKIIYKQHNGSVFAVCTTHRIPTTKMEHYSDFLSDSRVFHIYNQVFKKLLDDANIKYSKDDFVGKLNGRAMAVRGRIGVDLVFSMPKSCSIALFQNNGNNHDLIMNCHRNAIKSALKYVEQNLIYYRVSKGGGKLVKSQNGALFSRIDHFTNRNRDPHGHSHVIIFNNLKGNDGTIRRLENHYIFKNQKLIGSLYRSAMAAELMKNGFKIEITNPRSNIFELHGYRKEHLDFFSTRRNNVEEYLEKNNLPNNGKYSNLAAQFTKKAKKAVNFESLKKEWNAAFEKLGLNQPDQSIGFDYESFQKDKDQFFREKLDEMLEYKTAFTLDDFIYLVQKEGLDKCIQFEDIESFIQSNLSPAGEILVKKIDDQMFFYTQNSFDFESNIFKRLNQNKGCINPISAEIIESHLIDHKGILGMELSLDQLQSIRSFSCSDRFFAIQGDAGTGKTKMLEMVNHIFSSEGYSVIGASFQGKASLNLMRESGIESTTVHTMLNNWEKAAGNHVRVPGEIKNEWNLNGLKPGEKPELIVIDEASCIPNKLFDQIIDGAIRRNAQVVFVGDSKQLQPINSGMIFSDAISRDLISFERLNTNFRQKDNEILKAAIQHAIDQKPLDSLRRIENSIHSIPARKERLWQLSVDFTKMDQGKRSETFAFTGSNRDRNQINQFVQENLRNRGELLGSGKEFTLLEKAGRKCRNVKRRLFQGDRIVFLNNDRFALENGEYLKVKNGMFGKIQSIKGDNLKVMVDQKTIHIDTNRYKHFDLGYCITVHKSQGITVPSAVFVHIDTKQEMINSLNYYYVAITRSKSGVQIYTDTNDLSKLSESVGKPQEKVGMFEIMGNPEEVEIDSLFEDEIYQDNPIKINTASNEKPNELGIELL